MEQDVRHFIVIDDDAISNHVCSKGIEISFKNADIKTFTDPDAGLEHILSGGMQTLQHKTILFLDINMPGMSGWDILERFTALKYDITQQMDIYMLSSSVDSGDKAKAADNSLVTGYIEKPLTIKKIQKIFQLT